MIKIIRTLFFLLILLYGCSTNVSDIGGGSEAGNAKIAGTVYLENGNEGVGCLISAIPTGYIPSLHTAVPISRTVTNRQGTFSLELPGSDSFNLYIVDTATKEQMLIRDLYNTDKLLHIGDTYLKKPGTLKVIHPDISHTTCSFYIEGTEYTHTYSSPDSANDTLYIDILPSVELPTIQLTIGDKTISISKATIAPDKVVSIALDSTDKDLEVWNFSLIAGISKETMAATNNIDSLNTLIEEQIATINKRFNRDSKLQGIIHYSVDSVYAISGSVSEEIAKELHDFDYRIIYHGHGSGNFDRWTWDTRTIVNHQNETEGFGKSLFKKETTYNLVAQFALSRGCIETAPMEVSPLNNSISKSPYVPDLSIMFKPDVYTDWCSYNLAVLNLHKDSIVSIPFIQKATLQSSVSVSVTNFSQNIPKADATVELFWVDSATATVENSAAFSGKTDENGIYTFPSNPYRPESLQLPSEYYTNALIRVIHEGDTTHSWLPVLDLGEAYIKDSNADFTLEITL